MRGEGRRGGGKRGGEGGGEGNKRRGAEKEDEKTNSILCYVWLSLTLTCSGTTFDLLLQSR